MKPILQYRHQLANSLEALLDAKRKGANSTTPWESDYFDRLRPFMTGGKLLRGSLVCYTYSACRQRPPTRAVMRLAMALEITHAALLIHDDIMDQDDLRRGLPALHTQYQQLAESHEISEPHRFGENMALCGGDMAFFLAFELIGQARLDTRTNATITSIFSRELATVCGGQMHDTYLEATSHIPSKEAIYEVMSAKTASYSLTLPLIIGATMAQASPKTCQTMRHIGWTAGTIFQIRDDELGIMSNAATLGKPIGSDIKQGKKTLLYYYLSKQCSESEWAKLAAIFGNHDASEQDIRFVQTMVKRANVQELLNQEISGLQAQAMEHIETLDLQPRVKADLRALVRFCADRQT